MNNNEKNLNQLIQEKSPYLLQHKDNPVWWYPWSDDAFSIAKQNDKPIFLSIGYATCHWCHVMAHESFEDDDVANLLNKYFVSIKVDREEMPDIDQVYMKVLQTMTGHGGWPMTVVLTPEGKPFFSGTYFPKPNLLSILAQLSEAWFKRRDEVEAVAQEILSHSRSLQIPPAESEIDAKTLLYAGQMAKEDFDHEFGGFGGAPKFPPATRLQLLLRIYRRSKDSALLNIVTSTLKSMAYGGIYDHLGGGFARYSTDRQWRIPHFEKMLYDNSLLASTYLETYQLTADDFYLSVATETLDYILRDMTSPLGGFYSAEDADSEGSEGKFYVWTEAELKSILPATDFLAISSIFGITESGNFEGGTNVLTMNKQMPWTKRYEPIIARIRDRLLEVRSKRIRPLRDDKILTAWNGLAIDAFAKAYRLTENLKYLTAAQSAANFIKDTLWIDDVLFRRYRENEAKFPAVLDDYSFLIKGLLSLYQSDFAPKWVDWAIQLQSVQDRLFWDEAECSYWYSQSNLVIKLKEWQDGAEPNPIGYAVLNLFTLSSLTLDLSYRRRAIKILKTIAPLLERYPQAFSTLLHGVDSLTDRFMEAALIVPQSALEGIKDPIVNFLLTSYLPNCVVAKGESGSKLPLLAGKILLDNRTTAYICDQGTCQAPTNELAKVKELVTPKYIMDAVKEDFTDKTDL